jgi:hypothetical protein
MAGSIDWDQARFMESTVNIRRILRDATGHTPTANCALGTAVCLQQGRLFYEAAHQAPMEIRPLLIFYGMVNSAKALVLGQTGANLETLPQSHGIRDVTDQNAPLDAMKVKIEGKGTFQKFNDIVCRTNGFTFTRATMSERVLTPTAASEALQDMAIDLKAILGRIPEISALYRVTFDEEPAVEDCSICYWDNHDGVTELEVNCPRVFHSQTERLEIVKNLERRFPCLKDWCLVYAVPAYDKSRLKFANLSEPRVRTQKWPILETPDGQYEVDWLQRPDIKECIAGPFQKMLSPVAGRLLSRGPYLMEAINDAYVSELSLYYLGMFLLSSLVRYRPNIWARSISRLRLAQEGPDDRALALMENFMGSSMGVFHERIIELLALKETQLTMNNS